MRYLYRMAKVVKFPIQPPEKFGFRPVRKKREEPTPRSPQLPLFAGAKIVKLGRLSPFEEALILDENNDKAAKDHYLKAIKDGDSVSDAYCNLGIIESKLKNFPKAIDAFTLSLKEDPRHFESHYNLANLYAEIGNLPLAKIHYQMSITIEPEFPNSYFNLGLTLAMNEEIDEGVKTLLEYRRLTTVEDHTQVDELIEYLVRSGK